MNVIFNGLDLDPEPDGDLFVAQTRIDQRNDLALAGRDSWPFYPGLVPLTSRLRDSREQETGDFPRTDRLAGCHRADVLHKIFQRRLVRQATSGAGFDTSKNVRL